MGWMNFTESANFLASSWLMMSSEGVMTPKWAKAQPAVSKSEMAATTATGVLRTMGTSLQDFIHVISY